jgi:hypothetical protein
MGCWRNLTGYYCLVKAADIKQKATYGHLVLSCGSIKLTWMATKNVCNAKETKSFATEV